MRSKGHRGSRPRCTRTIASSLLLSVNSLHNVRLHLNVLFAGLVYCHVSLTHFKLLNRVDFEYVSVGGFMLSARVSCSGFLSQRSSSSRHGRVCASTVLAAQQRSNSTSSKISVDFDQSTGDLRDCFKCGEGHVELDWRLFMTLLVILWITPKTQPLMSKTAGMFKLRWIANL